MYHARKGHGFGFENWSRRPESRRSKKRPNTSIKGFPWAIRGKGRQENVGNPVMYTSNEAIWSNLEGTIFLQDGDRMASGQSLINTCETMSYHSVLIPLTTPL